MKRIISIGLVLILLLACIPVVSMAADPTSGRVIGGRLRLRAQPSTNAVIITAYPTGTLLTINRVYDADWYAVTGPDGRQGYVMSKFVDTTGTPPSPGGLYDATVISQNGKGVRMRYGPSTTYGVIAVYPVGTKVTVLNHGTYWDYIRVGLRTGYMMNQFLYSGAVPPAPTPTDYYYATVYASNGYGVRLRSYPSTSAPIIGLYSVGTSVLVLKHDTYWDYIRIGTRQGYMMNQFLVTTGNVTGVTVTPSAATVDKGDTTAFSATVTGTGYFNRAVKWTVSGNTSASTIVNAAGVLTVGADETAASISVRATSVYNANKYATATVTVTTPTPKPTVTDVIVTADGGATTVVKGSTQQFSARVEGTNNPPQTVTWRLSGTYDIGTTIDTAGKLTVSANETKTAITVMATSTADTAKNGTTTISVADKMVSSIAVKTQPSKLSYFDNETLLLDGIVVTITYADNTTKDVGLSDFGTNRLTASPANGAPLTQTANDGRPVVITHNNDAAKTASTNNLSVQPKTVSSIAIDTPPTKVDYIAGERFDPSGLKINVNYSDASISKVEYGSVTAASFSFNPDITEALTSAKTSVDITYAGASVSQRITVTEQTVESISIATQPDKLIYEAGKKIELDGLQVVLNYNVGNPRTKTVAWNDFGTNGLTVDPNESHTLTAGDNGKKILITHTPSGEIAETDALSIVSVTGISVTTDPSDMDYFEGQNLDLSGMVVQIAYSNSTTKDVEPKDFSQNGLSALPADGTQMTALHNGTPVTVTHAGISSSASTTSNLSVSAKTVTGIALNEYPELSYIEGQGLNLSGLSITLNYNNGDSENVNYTYFVDKLLTASMNNGDTLQTSDNGTVIKVMYNNDPSTEIEAGTLSVRAKALTSITVDITATPSVNTLYTVGDTFNPDNLVLNAVYDNGDTATIAYSTGDTNFSFNPELTTQLAETNRSVTIFYGTGGTSCELLITVSPAQTEP